MSFGKNSARTQHERVPSLPKDLFQNSKVNMKGIFVLNRHEHTKSDYGLFEMPANLNNRTGDLRAFRLKHKTSGLTSRDPGPLEKSIPVEKPRIVPGENMSTIHNDKSTKKNSNVK